MRLYIAYNFINCVMELKPWVRILLYITHHLEILTHVISNELCIFVVSLASQQSILFSISSKNEVELLCYETNQS